MAESTASNPKSSENIASRMIDLAVEFNNSMQSSVHHGPTGTMLDFAAFGLSIDNDDPLTAGQAIRDAGNKLLDDETSLAWLSLAYWIHLREANIAANIPDCIADREYLEIAKRQLGTTCFMLGALATRQKIEHDLAALTDAQSNQPSNQTETASTNQPINTNQRPEDRIRAIRDEVMESYEAFKESNDRHNLVAQLAKLYRDNDIEQLIEDYYPQKLGIDNAEENIPSPKELFEQFEELLADDPKDQWYINGSSRNALYHALYGEEESRWEKIKLAGRAFVAGMHSEHEDRENEGLKHKLMRKGKAKFIAMSRACAAALVAIINKYEPAQETSKENIEQNQDTNKQTISKHSNELKKSKVAPEETKKPKLIDKAKRLLQKVKPPDRRVIARIIAKKAL